MTLNIDVLRKRGEMVNGISMDPIAVRARLEARKALTKTLDALYLEHGIDRKKQRRLPA